MDATVEILVELTLDDIGRSERGTNYSPAFYAFRRTFGRDVLVMKGPSLASAQDKWQDHRDWIAVLPTDKPGVTRDFKLPPEWQKLLDFWSYGPGNDTAGPSELYRQHVKPISLTLPASK